MCKNPYMQGVLPFGCGQCMPCRINRRRLWAHRIVLESLKHASSSFVTLTYAPEHLPPDGSLVPRDPQLFLKRLRRAVEPLRIRFYLVGEYGERGFRPHYHACIFGLGAESAELIASCWALGHCHVGSLTYESAQYCAGYVTKKMTFADDPRLAGRHPEFARMSLRPGIGAPAMEELSEFLTTDLGSRLIAASGDVPATLKHGGKEQPLGRYLREKLRDALGVDSQAAKKTNLQRFFVEMQDVYDSIKLASPNESRKAQLVRFNKGKVRSLEARAKIYAKKEKL